MTRLIAFAALGAAALAAVPANAAPSTSAVSATPQAESRALILSPLSFVRVDDLDFGTVVSSSAAGTVTIDPGDGSRVVDGGVTALPSAAGGRGYFAGAGSPLQQVLVDLTPATLLTDPVTGNTITVVSMNLDGPATRTIDPDTRVFYVGVGGTIALDADQPDGDYVSDFDITADYQ